MAPGKYILTLILLLVLLGFVGEASLSISRFVSTVIFYTAYAGVMGFALLIYSRWKKLEKHDQAFVTNGGKYAALSGLVGSSIFIAIEETWLAVSFGFDPELFAISLIVSGLLTILPAFSGGVVFAMLLLWDRASGIYSRKAAIIKAVASGIFTGASICLVVGVLMRGGDFGLFMRRTIEVALLASLAAAWTGKKLADSIPLREAKPTEKPE